MNSYDLLAELLLADDEDEELAAPLSKCPAPAPAEQDDAAA